MPNKIKCCRCRKIMNKDELVEKWKLPPLPLGQDKPQCSVPQALAIVSKWSDDDWRLCFEVFPNMRENLHTAILKTAPPDVPPPTQPAPVTLPDNVLSLLDMARKDWIETHGHNDDGRDVVTPYDYIFYTNPVPNQCVTHPGDNNDCKPDIDDKIAWVNWYRETKNISLPKAVAEWRRLQLKRGGRV